MTDDPSKLPESPTLSDSSSPSLTGKPAADTASPRGRSAGARSCPNCGSGTPTHASVCPECGESLKDRGGRIRCRYCGERSAVELTLCPHCGRELTSAPSRLITWGIPAALVVLFMVFIVRQADGTNPVSWAQDRLSVEGFGSQDTAARGLAVVMTPVPSDVQPVSEAPVVQADPEQEVLAEDALAEAEAAVVSAPAEAAAPEAPAANGDEPAALDVTVEPAAEENESPTQADTGDSSLTVTPAAETAVTDNSAVPAITPAITPTSPAAPDPGNAVMVAAASLSDATDSPELPSATPTNTETATPQSTSTPTQTPTPVPSDTATPAPMPTYAIQRGDTLVVVARRTGVSVEDLMRVNGISAADAFTIQPGQELLIPVEGSIGAEEPTPAPTAAATPTTVSPPTVTPFPTPTTPALRLDAPILRSPEPGTPVSCSEPTSLVWLPVPFMRAEDKFVLHLGFVNGRMEDGRDIVVWVLEQPRPANVTSWDMDGSLCSLAPQEYGRRWHWFVEVAEEVDGVLKPVSPPSETWDFSWN